MSSDSSFLLDETIAEQTSLLAVTTRRTCRNFYQQKRVAACGTNIYKVENVGDGGGSIYHFDRDIPAAAELLPVTRLQY